MKKNLLLTLIYCLLFIQFSWATGMLKSRVKFATLKKASVLLDRDDEYTLNLSLFDIEAKMQKVNATRAEQMAHITAELREWDAAEIQIINTQIELIDEIIEKNNYHLPLPDTLFFIKSTMNDEGGAGGYTRANCIVLKEGIKIMPAIAVEHLVLHELFHVMTRYDKIFRRDMYLLIGFELMPEMAYPPELKDFKISNPDAPFKDSYVKLKKDGKDIECMMILYSKAKYGGGSFFNYLQIGFLKIRGGANKEIDYADGKAVVYTMDEVEGFYEQVGRNTDYMIDPEETLADNFVYAVVERKDLPSPLIPENIRKRLKK